MKPFRVCECGWGAHKTHTETLQTVSCLFLFNNKTFTSIENKQNMVLTFSYPTSPQFSLHNLSPGKHTNFELMNTAGNLGTRSLKRKLHFNMNVQGLSTTKTKFPGSFKLVMYQAIKILIKIIQYPYDRKLRVHQL